MSNPVGLQTRQVALHLLSEILLRKNPLDQLLSRDKKYYALESREKNLARMIVATALRRKGQMDDLIVRAQDKPQDLNPPLLKLVLYVGITQILFMEVADHAAVDTTVELAEAERLGRQKGFVNAILRRIIREGKSWVDAQDPVQINMLEWLLAQWTEDYGLDQAIEIAKASLSEAHVDITVANELERDYWASELEANILPTGSLRRKSGGAITELSGFDDGAWWVQDASAALPVHVLGDVSGKTIIDLCAAPGGKTAQLAAGGANVIALDRSAKRMDILRQNMERLKLGDMVEVVIGDGTVWQPSEPADIVLLDAPCSATGTIRRHPDLMHLKSEKDVTQLIDIQRRLLDNAASMLKSDGLLIYCTCSLQKSEGEKQMSDFLSRHKDFQTVPINENEVGNIENFIDSDGHVRILPTHLAPHGGMDGFFIARLVKQ